MVVDTQTSMPCDKSHEAQNAFKDWMIHEECRSHDVSQFAAFFIVARAKRSIVKSCLNVFYIACIHYNKQHTHTCVYVCVVGRA